MQVSLNGKPDDPIGSHDRATDGSIASIPAAPVDDGGPFDRAGDAALSYRSGSVIDTSCRPVEGSP